MSKTLDFIHSVAIPYGGDECLEWPFAHTEKHRPLFKRGGKNVLVCRYICQAVHGLPPSATHQAAHSCGRGHLGCVNPRHLRWATPSENQQDRSEHGTSNRGERNGSSKLDAAKVMKIAGLLRDRVPQRQIAEQFDICPSFVSFIATGKNWSHVTGIPANG